MTIVVEFDVHRAQITYDALNSATGEVRTGRIAPADRTALRTFLRRWAGEHVEAAVEATTGWRVVGRLDGRDAHEQLAALELSPAAQRQITVALAVIGHVNSQLAPLDRDLKAFARAQPGCRALMRHYGIGPQVACAILAELGDARRFSSSRRSVRFAGLDITVHESDPKRRAGHRSPRPAGAALGGVRGRRIGHQARLTRPRLLPRAQAARVSQPGTAVGRAQAAAPRAPNAARTRRRRARAGRLSLDCRRPASASPDANDDRGQLPTN